MVLPMSWDFQDTFVPTYIILINRSRKFLGHVVELTVRGFVYSLSIEFR